MMPIAGTVDLGTTGEVCTASPSVVSPDRKAPDGEGLQMGAPYKKKLTLAGLQLLSARESFVAPRGVNWPGR